MSDADPLGDHRKARQYEAPLCEELEGGIKNTCSAFNSALRACRHAFSHIFDITPKGSRSVRQVIFRALRNEATCRQLLLLGGVARSHLVNYRQSRGGITGIAKFCWSNVCIRCTCDG